MEALEFKKLVHDQIITFGKVSKELDEIALSHLWKSNTLERLQRHFESKSVTFAPIRSTKHNALKFNTFQRLIILMSGWCWERLRSIGRRADAAVVIWRSKGAHSLQVCKAVFLCAWCECIPLMLFSAFKACWRACRTVDVLVMSIGGHFSLSSYIVTMSNSWTC